MDGLATERLKLALKVLDSLYGCTVKVTNAEIETLKKSCVAGDLAGLEIDDIVVASGPGSTSEYSSHTPSINAAAAISTPPS